MNYQIIAVDFDGTLCFSKWPELGEPNKPLIEYLKSWRNQGNKLILWTCRAGEALDKAVSWCQDQQLYFDAVNDNLPEVIEMYGNNSRKITCDYYIDDKAMLPGMIQAQPYGLRLFTQLILLDNVLSPYNTVFIIQILNSDNSTFELSKIQFRYNFLFDI